MKGLYIGGTPGSGKTALAVGIALQAREEGLRVSYFKPVGGPPSPVRSGDEDAVLMKELLHMTAPAAGSVLFTAGPYYLSRHEKGDHYLKVVRDTYRQFAEGTDLVIVGGGPWPEALAPLGLDVFTLARELGCQLLLVARMEDDYSFDSLFLYNELARALGLAVVGNVLNHVPRELEAKCEGVYKPYLEDHGHRVVGIIPRRPDIASPTVKEFHDVLGGEVLVREDMLGLMVEDILVGAMAPDSALSYFRRVPHKAVVTGGDRTDIALAALETSTSVLILTGGLYPHVGVISRAAEKGVPVILVHYDTYTAIEKVHQVSRKIRPGDKKGIAAARENLTRYCDWPSIRQTLGLPASPR